MEKNKKYYIICNPLSKIAKTEKIKKIECFLKNKNLNYNLIFSNYSGHTILISEKIANNIDKNEEIIIIAIGGDGTLREVIEGILKKPKNLSKIKVSLIPSGTANVIAHELNLSFNIDKALNLILQEKTITIPISQADDSYFIFTCGIGYDGLCVHEVNLNLKKYIGKFAYMLAGIKSWFKLKKLIPIKLKINNSFFYAQTAIINRTKNYAGKIPIFQRANISEEFFEVLIFKKLTFFVFFNFLIDVLINKKINSKNYTFVRTSEIKIIGEMPSQIDGDPLNKTPEKIKFSNYKINFIIP